jgi:hypothetical protein
MVSFLQAIARKQINAMAEKRKVYEARMIFFY